MFSGTFQGSDIKFPVQAESGSDVNYIKSNILSSLQSDNNKSHASRLPSPNEFKGVGTHAQISCSNSITLSLLLRIRHARNLFIRNVWFFVGDSPGDNVIVGRPLMEKLGINTRELLDAVHDYSGGTVDLSSITPNNAFLPSISINQLTSQGIFHSAAANGEQDDHGNDDYIDLGEDNPAELKSELDKRVDEAVTPACRIITVDD